jgi:hypothetical protein
MKWTKLGVVFVTDNDHPWMHSHAANPVAEHLSGDVFRIYFSCRDKESRSHIAFAEIDVNPPFRVLRIAQEPILAPGRVGTFDDSGVSLSCVTVVRGNKYLYYLGGILLAWLSVTRPLRPIDATAKLRCSTEATWILTPFRTLSFWRTQGLLECGMAQT